MKTKVYTTAAGLILPMTGFAQNNESSLNSGDTAWVLVATALVMLMTPAGLALFYGGLTRSKNVLNTIGMSYIAFCLTTVVWVLVGYSLSFGGEGMLLGNLENLLLSDIKITDTIGTIPTYLFVAFQGTFAAIAVAIISGSIIERIKFSTWIVFAVFWIVCVYSPVAHWVWGGGFLSNSGELDFAGGTVIHINAGIAGLVVSMLVGKRKSFGTEEKPSSVKLTVLGSALLWFGWFGFNAGSQLAADFIAANAFLVTNVAACAGGLAWLLFEYKDTKKPTLIGTSTGVISGLVAITPAAGYVDVSAALCIGILGGLVGYFGAVKLKKILKYDDTLDAFGVHGLVGIAGALATGVFANPEINEATGMLYGNPEQLWVQCKAVGVVVLFSAVGTYATFKAASWITKGARVTENVEDLGLDAMIHGERSFDNTEDEIMPRVRYKKSA